MAMSLMSGAEFVLWAMLGLLFWRKNLHRRFPAMGSYLALHVLSTPILLALLYAQSQPSWAYLFPLYFFSYWVVYIASAVLLFFICTEIFRFALSGFPGLIKFGVVVFRWAVLASVVVSLSTLSYSHRGILIIPDIAFGLMRSVSILELCLLAFLCLSMNALRLSVRDLTFGISLGFGLMSANDFILATLTVRYASFNTPLQFVYESLILAVLGTWVAYFALPEPARQPMMMPANSTIYRWNEIASALGHTGTHVAVRQPTNAFFLTDVENVVERVLARNLKKKRSEL